MTSPGSRLAGPAFLLLAATIVSGGCGYLVGVLVPLRAGVEVYAAFAALWSVLFFLISTVGGLQQELTRAVTVSPVAAPAARRRAWVFAITAALIVAALVLASGPLWLAALPGSTSPVVVTAVAIGVAFYVGVAVVCGALYGVQRWRPLAVMICLDGVLRLGGVAVVLAAGGGIGPLAVALVLPFPLTLVLVVPIVAGRLRVAAVDVSMARLGWNALRLVATAAATGVLVSGAVLLIRLGIPHLSAREFAPLALALTLTRAPLVVPAIALQSYLIVLFRERGAGRVLPWGGLVLAAAVAIAALTALVGPAVIRWIFGTAYDIDPLALGLIVGSSGGLAALIVVGASLVARGRHGYTTIAWLIAVVATVGLLPVPIAPGMAVGIAFAGGALAGLIAGLVLFGVALRARATEPLR